MKKTTRNTQEFQTSTVFLLEHLVSLPSGTSVEIRTLSFKEYYNIVNKYSKTTNTLQYKLVEAALVNMDIQEIVVYSDIQFLADVIIKISCPDDGLYNATEVVLNILKENAFSDETFHDCNVCKSHGLDVVRNCPLLDVNTHTPSVFYIVGDTKLDVCPMDVINNTNLRSQVMEVFSVFSNKVLPEVGGLVDQTIFFYNTASLIVGKLKTPNPITGE